MDALRANLAVADIDVESHAVDRLNSALAGGGILIALAGCQQGMACGNSAMAVGESTTRAVVMGIVLIVVSASVLTIIYINLGI